MRRLSAFLTRFSPGWIVILATTIFVLFMVFVLPGQAAEAQTTSGGSGSPDTSFWYSAQELLQFAEDYGEEGRAAYIRARWTFDLIYPLVYGFFLISTVSWFFARAVPAESGWRRTNLIPLFGMIFDYLENSATSLVMARFPLESSFAANLAPFLTLLKWFFVMGSFLFLLVGMGWAIYARIHSHPKPPAANL